MCTWGVCAYVVRVCICGVCAYVGCVCVYVHMCSVHMWCVCVCVYVYMCAGVRVYWPQMSSWLHAGSPLRGRHGPERSPVALQNHRIESFRCLCRRICSGTQHSKIPVPAISHSRDPSSSGPIPEIPVAVVPFPMTVCCVTKHAGERGEGNSLHP